MRVRLPDARVCEVGRQQATARPEVRRHRLDGARPAPDRVTGMAEIGIAPHIVEAVVNHVSGHKGGVAGIYNRAKYSSEKRAGLQRWADHVERLVTGGAGANVVAFR